jgi:hypothetical protein
MEYRWETTRSVVLTKGELTEQQEKEILRDGDVRFVGYGAEPPMKAYSQFWFVNATTAEEALNEAAERLDSLLKPYEVEFFTYRASASAHREKVVQVRMP